VNKSQTKYKKAFFLSISSDIASYIALKLLEEGTEIHGTFRTSSDTTEKLRVKGAHLYKLNCFNSSEIEELFKEGARYKDWDLAMISPATGLPINRFDLCDWKEWEDSFSMNSLRQFQVIHRLLPLRSKKDPFLFLWSGPGTNNAPKNYSALTTAKIAQIKMCELLDAEFEDLRSTIVGPGWVNTKGHKETLQAKNTSGENYQRTLNRINSDNTTSLERIYDFFKWCSSQEKSVVSGRNFSIQGDIWGDDSLNTHLLSSANAFKMRRFDNDWKPNEQKTSFEPPKYKL